MRVHRTAAAFAGAAAEYERGRPGYPEEAVGWLAERLGLSAGRTVLDLAAGTGKLTRQLVATGAEVVAVEPLDEMRAELAAAVPAARALAGTAEQIPLADGSVDAVTVAQAYHWFDPPQALREIHRVLRSGRAFALVWNGRDLDDPLQAAIGDLLEPLRQAADLKDADPEADFARSGLFSPPEKRRFVHEQDLIAERVLDRVASTSVVAALAPDEREGLLGNVSALLAGEKGPIVLRYVTEVFVSDRR